MLLVENIVPVGQINIPQQEICAILALTKICDQFRDYDDYDDNCDDADNDAVGLPLCVFV